MDQQRRKELLQYIAIQWADIHHSRNQDWKVLLIVAGVYSALFVANGEKRGGTGLQVAISLTGIIACIVGGYMARAHWRIFSSKLKVIRACEQKVGIVKIKLLGNCLAVQGLILLVYFLLGAPLAGWVMWLWRRSLWASFLVSVLVVISGVAICFWQQWSIRNQVSTEVEIELE